MYFNQTWQEILNWTRAFADIAIVWFILYYSIKIVRNNSRTIQIFKGIILVVMLKSLANFFGLTTIGLIADIFVSYGFLAIIVIFQPEIRSLLERLGKSNVFSRLSTLSGNEKERLVDELVKATMILSKSHTGALITLEQGQALSDYIKTGTLLNSLVSTELLTSIFVTSTPLHDGAVIIQGDRIACASAYFPPTNLELPNRYGARHRAAIGISEVTDSITIVISEETGAISIAEDGKLRTVDSKELRDYLLRVLCNEETELNKGKARPTERKVFMFNEDKVEEKTVVVEEVEPQDLIEKSEIQHAEKHNLFSMLAIKKQPKSEVGIGTEIKMDEKPKGLFARRKDRKVTEKSEVMEKLEREEMDIKLPHKPQKDESSVEAVESIEVILSTLETKKEEPIISSVEGTMQEIEEMEKNIKAKLNKKSEEKVVDSEKALDDMTFEFSGTIDLNDINEANDLLDKQENGGHNNEK